MNEMWSLVKWWNRNTNFRPLLQSRLILYFLFFLSLLTLYGYAVNRQFVFATVFIIVAFLTSFFSKNMIVILFLALATTNIIIQGLGMNHRPPPQYYNKIEGMTSQDNDENVAEDSDSSSTSSDAFATSSSESIADKSEELKKMLITDKKSSGGGGGGGDENAAAKKEIKNLLDLQLKLMTGMNGLQPILKDVESALSNMRNNSALQ